MAVRRNGAGGLEDVAGIVGAGERTSDKCIVSTLRPIARLATATNMLDSPPSGYDRASCEGWKRQELENRPVFGAKVRECEHAESHETI